VPEILATLRRGLSTGEPKWVIPVAILLAAGVLTFANLPVGEGVEVRGLVKGCVTTVQRLTGGQVVSCRVELVDGTVQQIEMVGFSDEGSVVVIRRYPRRFFGYSYSR
jgi:hypothetical protein